MPTIKSKTMNTAQLITLLLFVTTLPVFSQSTSPKETTKEIHWSSMIQDPRRSYYEVKEAFDKEWKLHQNKQGYNTSIFRRWEEFMIRNMDENGYYDPLEEEKNYLNWRQQIERNSTSRDNSNWEFVGPMSPPLSEGRSTRGIGRARDIGFHPSDPTLFYVAAETGGLWKTQDSGKTYSFLSSTWPTNIVNSIHINPNDPAEIIVFTRGYINHTTNSGKTWSHDFNLIHRKYSDYLVNFTDNIIMHTDNLYNTTFRLSKDKEWVLDEALEGMYCIEQHPEVEEVVYGISENHFYYSNDGAKSFQIQKAQNIVFGQTTNKLAFSREDSEKVWVLAVEENKLLGVYYSSDKGDTFTQILDPESLILRQSGGELIHEWNASTFFGTQGYIHSSIAVSPEDSDWIIVGGVNLIETRDGGENWNIASIASLTNTIHVDHLRLRFQPVTNKLFSCNDGGIYRNSNEYEVDSLHQDYIWDGLNKHLPITQIYNISISTDGLFIITGQQDNGSFFYDRTTQSWKIISGGDGMGNGFDPSNSNNLIWSFQRGELIYSENQGANYKRLTSRAEDIFNGERPTFYTKVLTHPLKPGVVYHLRDNLWESKNYGKTWTNITSSIQNSLRLGDLVISSDNPDNMLLLDSYEDIYQTIDGGKNWQKLDNPDPDTWISDIGIHSSEPLKIWKRTFRGLNYSEDGGQTWWTYEDWPNITINKIVHVSGTEDELLVATNKGLLHKPNGADRFKEFGQGLPKVSVTDFEISYCTGEVFVSTYGLGVWKNNIDLSEQSCCHLAPSIIQSPEFICEDNNTIELAPLNETNYIWQQDGITLDERSNKLVLNESGRYEFFTETDGCESAHYIRDLSTLPNSEIWKEGCGDFEIPENDPILILSEVPNTLTNSIYQAECERMQEGVFAFTIDETIKGSRSNIAKDDFVFLTGAMEVLIQNPSLSFDISTLYENGRKGSELIIEASNDCGKTFKEIYKEEDNQYGIPINDRSEENFVPEKCEDWNTIQVDLADYADETIILKFKLRSFGISIFGPADSHLLWLSNVYIDNICITQNEFSTRTEERQLTNKVSVYPNPSSGFYRVQSELPIIHMKVFDAAGKAISFIRSEDGIDIHENAKGTYVLEVLTEETVNRFILIKH